MRLPDGGGVREIIYFEDEEIMLDHIKNKSIEYFFPQEKLKYGYLKDMNMVMKLYARGNREFH